MSEELTPWEKYKQNLGETRPWDLLNPNKPRAENELAELRYSICLECPFLIKLSKQCRKCGCFMDAKTKLLGASCPIGKW
jgi:hypothetical protein